LPALEAAAKVKSILTQLAKQQALSDFRLIYKKIDSTLRGHPSTELRALIDSCGAQPVLIAPAYPAQGRTTRDGIVWVNDTPLSQSTFASDICNGDLKQVFGRDANLIPLSLIRQGDAALRTFFRNKQGIILADAENNADLQSLARTAIAEGIRVFCGSAGLAGAITQHLYQEGLDQLIWKKSIPPQPHHRHILGVVGSLHPATRAQVNQVRSHGIEVVTPPKIFFYDAGDAGIEETADSILAGFKSGNPIILSTLPSMPHEERLSSRIIAMKLAQAAVIPIPKDARAGLFLTGGDTAMAVCSQLGCAQIWLGGEVENGMPWSYSDPLSIVTKAGGFGHDLAIIKALNWLIAH
jgi:D-threonate/D-erythronate kinase